MSVSDPDPASAWTDRVRTVYDRTARGYDLALSLFPAVGFRAGAYRRHAIEALRVQPGDMVLDLGCGTGRNLPLLARAVGEEGRVVGLDVSSAALDRARKRTLGLPQVELVQADALTADLGTADRVLATFSLSMMPDPEAVIARAAGALAPGGRFAVLDFRIPRSWPGLVQTAAFALAVPLGETWEMARRDLRPTLADHVTLDADRSFFFGAAYVVAGSPR
jgi:demethylmenaquinone methyltransferase/2-methoxy-6-polyprenyl-1,4-benzoquinol methylase